MLESKNTHICTPTESYVVEYPEFNKLADTQLEKCFWTHSEISLEKDKQDLLTALTESEKHAVITALKLFTKYELRVGEAFVAYGGDETMAREVNEMNRVVL